MGDYYWDHPNFPNYYDTLLKINAQSLRQASFTQCLITETERQQLSAMLGNALHNEHYLALLNPGAERSFRGFLTVLEKMGRNYDSLRAQLCCLMPGGRRDPVPEDLKPSVSGPPVTGASQRIDDIGKGDAMATTTAAQVPGGTEVDTLKLQVLLLQQQIASMDQQRQGSTSSAATVTAAAAAAACTDRRQLFLEIAECVEDEFKCVQLAVSLEVPGKGSFVKNLLGAGRKPCFIVFEIFSTWDRVQQWAGDLGELHAALQGCRLETVAKKFATSLGQKEEDPLVVDMPITETPVKLSVEAAEETPPLPRNLAEDAERYRGSLKRNFATLKDAMRAKDCSMKLWQKDIITYSELEEVQNLERNKSTADANTHLLQQLRHCDDQGIVLFVEDILVEVKQKHLSDLLQK